MRVAYQVNQVNTDRRASPPAIPFERPPVVKLPKDQAFTVTLRTNIDDPQSQTYSFTIPLFRNGTPEQWLVTQKSLAKIFAGQGITTGQGKFAMARRVLEGQSLTYFENALAGLTNPDDPAMIAEETNANYELVMQEVTKRIFPTRALIMQRRIMRRDMRKPMGVKTRDYVARMLELNEYLDMFPPVPTTNGQPPGPKKMQPDEMMDILEHGIPVTWFKAMVVQGFDPLDSNPDLFTQFCERMEFSEAGMFAERNGAMPKTMSRTGKGTTWSPKGKPRKAAYENNRKYKKNKQEKYCPLHGVYGHDANECKVLLGQAKNMKAAWENKGPTGYAKGPNKVFQGKPHNNKKYYEKKDYKNNENKTPEINLIVEKAVQKALDGKRHGKRKHSDDDDEVEENYNVDEFESLSLGSDDSSKVKEVIEIDD